MKVAILADIHANLPALQTVIAHMEAWKPDAVLMAGDVVNRGPKPAECMDLVQEKQISDGWLAVRGNHEDYVLTHNRPEAHRSGPEFEVFRNSYWTYQQLNGQVTALEAMPFQVSISGPDGSEIRVVHASMRDNRDGIFPETTDDELRCQIAPPPAVLCVGHTHQPLVRQIDSTLVVNAGSIGAPFDSDWRAAYAQLTCQNGRWQAVIVRLEYDQGQTERDFFETGFIPDAGDLVQLMYLEFKQARSHLHLWMKKYHQPVLDGEITMAKSVQDYLRGLKPL